MCDILVICEIIAYLPIFDPVVVFGKKVQKRLVLIVKLLAWKLISGKIVQLLPCCSLG